MHLPDDAYTQACEDRDFVEWHHGCPWCAVWVLRIDSAQVQQWMAAGRSSIAPYVLARYARQAHVTVAYRGLMADAQPHPRATFSQVDLQRDIAQLKAAGLAPLALQLQGVGSFATVPYIGVQAGLALQQWHEALAAQHAPDFEGRYVPHLTLGHYACAMPVAKVLQYLQQVLPAGVLWQSSISRLWLARYRSHDIAGPLYWEGCLDVRTGRYEAQPDALLQP